MEFFVRTFFSIFTISSSSFVLVFLVQQFWTGFFFVFFWGFLYIFCFGWLTKSNAVLLVIFAETDENERLLWFGVQLWSVQNMVKTTRVSTPKQSERWLLIWFLQKRDKKPTFETYCYVLRLTRDKMSNAKHDYSGPKLKTITYSIICQKSAINSIIKSSNFISSIVQGSLFLCMGWRFLVNLLKIIPLFESVLIKPMRLAHHPPHWQYVVDSKLPISFSMWMLIDVNDVKWCWRSV